MRLSFSHPIICHFNETAAIRLWYIRLKPPLSSQGRSARSLHIFSSFVSTLITMYAIPTHNGLWARYYSVNLALEPVLFEWQTGYAAHRHPRLIYIGHSNGSRRDALITGEAPNLRTQKILPRPGYQTQFQLRTSASAARVNAATTPGHLSCFPRAVRNDTNRRRGNFTDFFWLSG